jgi:signal transduction histidine kinase
MKIYVSKGVLVSLSISAILLFFITASGVSLAQKYQQSPASLPNAEVIIQYFSALGIIGAVILVFTFFALRRHAIRERALLDNERRSRRSAELLQDILAHDIRNYNQIVVTSAELLKDDPASAEERQSLIDAILKATKGSSDLIDRAKKLGRILSQAEVKLRPVELEPSLKTSVDLVIDAHPERSINLSSSGESGARVIADDLLEEAFTNILSNSVNYTEKDEVPVEIKVEEQEAAIIGDERRPYWKITFTDQGKGIPDKVKETIFTRYLSTATGAGLGLSIVYALVVERYSGKVAITDRVKGDFTKGTRVEVWLPKAR